MERKEIQGKTPRVGKGRKKAFEKEPKGM